MLDFLKEIVEAVPDPSAGGTIDLDSESAEGAKKKRGKGKRNGGAPAGGETVARKRRKKKGEADGDTAADVEDAPEGEGRSEPEGDAMDDEEERPGYGSYGGTSYGARREDPEESEWREGEEDEPYLPRR